MSSRSEQLKTPLCRLAFANGLFTPVDKASGSGKQFTCSLLFPKTTNIDAMRKAAGDAAVAEWGDKAAQMIKDGLIKTPFLDGDGPQGKSKKNGAPHAGFPGTIFVRPNSGEDYKPGLFNRRREPATKDDVYSGVWGYAVLQAYTWTNDQGGKGVSFNISMFQAAKDDEKLGGGEADPEKWFDTIEDAGEAPSETKSGAGAAGLFA